MKKIFLCIIFLLSFSVVDAAGCEALLTRDAAEFIGDIVTVVRIGVPILLVVLCSTDFVAIVTGQDESVTKKSISRIVKRFICAAAFFFVPLILQFILGLDVVNNALNLVDDPSCGLDGDLDGYKTEEEIQKETEKKLEEERKKKEEEKKKKEEEEKKKQLKCDKYGTYNGVKFCAPNASYRFGSASSTGGCGSKKVQHDSSYPANTPVYAAIDGTIEYRQTYCKDELYSYGNHAILKGSDGTKIYYAHFSKFVDGITPKITKNCKWLSNSSPCPSTACSGGVRNHVLGTMTVKAGQLIGYSGTTGNSLGPHLHVEIHFKGGECLSDLNSAFGL